MYQRKKKPKKKQMKTYRAKQSMILGSRVKHNNHGGIKKKKKRTVG